METSSITNSSGAVGTRLLCAFGALLTGALVVLGGIWPSVFTLVAILALPAPFMFLFAVFRPTFFRSHRLVRYYLLFCSVAAALCWIDEVVWLHTT